MSPGYVRMNKVIVLLVLGGILTAVLYVRVTPFSTLEYDCDSHLWYIQHILKNHSLPAINADFESYQPPFYYLIASAWALGSDYFVKDINQERSLQYLGFCLFSLSLLVAGLAWNQISKKEPLHWIGLFLFIFLPGHLFFSARVNNDVILPALGIGIFYSTWMYVQKPSLRWLISGSLMSVLIFFTKFSGIATWISFCSVIVCSPSFVDIPKKKYRQHCALAILPGLASVIFWMIRAYVKTGDPLYTSISQTDMIHISYHVPNNLYRFLVFDLVNYVKHPFADMDAVDLKFSLLAFTTATALHALFIYDKIVNLCRLLNVSFLLVLVSFLNFFVSWWRSRENLFYQLCATFFFFHFAFFLAVNYREPIDVMQDYRYMAPCFFVLGLQASIGTTKGLTSKSKILKIVTRAGLVVFPIFLGAFYLKILKLGL